MKNNGNENSKEKYLKSMGFEQKSDSKCAIRVRERDFTIL